MDYTLWRGSVQLGRIRLAFSEDDPELVHGMLEINTGGPDIQPIHQSEFRHGDRVLVRQDSLPDFSSLPASNSQQTHATVSVGPRVLSPEEALGVPPEHALTLRDSHGHVVATDSIMVTRLPDAFMRSRGWIAKCAEAGVSMSPWSVGAHRFQGSNSAD